MHLSTHWGFHGKEGYNLQQVILQHISDDAVRVEVASSALGAKIFTENDLDISDELSAPQWLKYQIRKPEHLHKHVWF